MEPRSVTLGVHRNRLYFDMTLPWSWCRQGGAVHWWWLSCHFLQEDGNSIMHQFNWPRNFDDLFCVTDQKINQLHRFGEEPMLMELMEIFASRRLNIANTNLVMTWWHEMMTQFHHQDHPSRNIKRKLEKLGGKERKKTPTTILSVHLHKTKNKGSQSTSRTGNISSCPAVLLCVYTEYRVVNHCVSQQVWQCITVVSKYSNCNMTVDQRVQWYSTISV